MRFSILVCDDSTVARKQVMRCLKECIDADIQQATNGKEALEQLRQRHFDLLCLDSTGQLFQAYDGSWTRVAGSFLQE